jgi:hypothetical protein
MIVGPTSSSQCPDGLIDKTLLDFARFSRDMERIMNGQGSPADSRAIPTIAEGSSEATPEDG